MWLIHVSGALVCVVGRVGTGKSALLSGMINEMKQIRGQTMFGGSVSYGRPSTWMLTPNDMPHRHERQNRRDATRMKITEWPDALRDITSHRCTFSFFFIRYSYLCLRVEYAVA